MKKKSGDEFKIARGLLNKKLLKHLRKISDKEEKLNAIRYAIRSELEKEYHYLEKEVKNLKERGKDVFHIEMKLLLLKSKIKLLIATYHKKDFDKIKELKKEILKEMKNV